ncbi:EAL domain-containing protein [Sphingosinicella sp. LHD-64]|uniref:EAL domain-containing protein n=1 Tax=Sphingosinicella sp. LHD-64 TaxID=3072139 RepID=UPI00280F1393|nr:EAL domain-containing protein [Sphingosinicella sp. LHD-64]MDQ8756025.1 EAL domain-containing protein [Sphingosinicella sp. LHD-64]
MALVVGLIFGVAQAGKPIENWMQIARNKLRSHPASGEIVLVAIDDRSLTEVGAVPWNGSLLADLIRRIDAAGARNIHLDDELRALGSPAQASQLEATLAQSRANILLPSRFSVDPVSGTRTDYRPVDRFARHAQVVNTNLWLEWDDAVWSHPYAVPDGSGTMLSLGSVLGGVNRPAAELFPIDYGIDIQTIPTVSASDILFDRYRSASIADKDIVIARTDTTATRQRVPGFRPVPVILFHIVAAETLRSGIPMNLGWAVPFGVALLVSGVALYTRRRVIAGSVLAVATGGAIAAPILLEAHHIYVQVVPALAVLVAAALIRLTASLKRSYNARGTTNLVTGMPNLQALRQAGSKSGVVIAARINNYAQITMTLPPQHEKELVEQIVGRLEFGATGADIFQADEGIFVWTSRIGIEDGLIQQLEGLQGLFRSPVVVSGRLIDLTVTFGLDPDGSRPLVQRVSSALVAADEAARDGKRWASFNPASVEDADWEMSLLARLDHAIDHGEIWIAYQPKKDCRSGQLIGAEALVRWTHPEKGAIYPDQFIGAAEQGGRIERLTYHVLDQALAGAAAINRRKHRFNVAVNLSVLLLDSKRLVSTVETLLQKHGVDPASLTLEVTETSTLGSAATQIANLERLSAMGIQLSIDDYGTGFSTLEYLRRIPASEIKIDRSFISMLDSSQSDRIMVNSTIQLAHSLGRKVVAEGVESEAILTELKRMHCDIAQGYHVGRPMPFADLLEQLGLAERAA